MLAECLRLVAHYSILKLESWMNVEMIRYLHPFLTTNCPSQFVPKCHVTTISMPFGDHYSSGIQFYSNDLKVEKKCTEIFIFQKLHQSISLYFYGPF